MITVEDWAEIRRLHRAEKLPKKQIAEKLGVSRTTVYKALESNEPPKYQREAKGSLADAVLPEIHKLLKDTPRMPATVIAERIGWDRSLTILKDKIREIRPLYTGVDPADRLDHKPGEAAQFDLWFPEPQIPVGYGQARMLPVLVMTLTFSRFLTALMIPSRQSGDLLAGMWQLISGVGAVSKSLIWDREAAIAPKGRPLPPVQAFAGTTATKMVIAPPRDPEFKGMTERNNDYFETSFLPGRRFASPDDFNTQISAWITERANQRLVRSLGDRPINVVGADLAAMTALPPSPPVTGFHQQVRLGRDYYLRVDTNDYSVDPRFIGRLVQVTATLGRVVVLCDGAIVADHPRCWAKAQVVTDSQHVATAKALRSHFNQVRRQPAGGDTEVAYRPLSVYDELFGLTSTTVPAKDDRRAA
ncbi:IS21 family transposase [Nesterenkonia massiliensis]|uniref:IS21 family transposase n=1 Tax=Nesterenkonia massiliensis TaxID=1232429 RepID=A0ABT2HTN5_9MICC|nr:IS21 family transposase [Nesterenkonia massiliensis]MCT1608056.1 IS21 family transposase [Nesterenkonia massiliensis]